MNVKPPPLEPRYLTARQLARLKLIPGARSRNTVSKLIHAGKLKAELIGTTFVVRYKDVQKYVSRLKTK